MARALARGRNFLRLHVQCPLSLPPRAKTTTEAFDTLTESRLHIPAFGADQVGVTGRGVVTTPPSGPPEPAADAVPSTWHAPRVLRTARQGHVR